MLVSFKCAVLLGVRGWIVVAFFLLFGCVAIRPMDVSPEVRGSFLRLETRMLDVMYCAPDDDVMLIDVSFEGRFTNATDQAVIIGLLKPIPAFIAVSPERTGLQSGRGVTYFHTDFLGTDMEDPLVLAAGESVSRPLGAVATLVRGDRDYLEPGAYWARVDTLVASSLDLSTTGQQLWALLVDGTGTLVHGQPFEFVIPEHPTLTSCA